MVLDHVAFDIETTGFGATDEVTVVGFAAPTVLRMFVQTDGASAQGVADALEAATTQDVTLSTHTAERALLEAVTEFTAAEFAESNALVVAYNGERWNGGFDLPFLRTRYATHGIRWPFADVPYADLLPIISDRFNTTVDGDEQNTLTAAYNVLCDGTDDEIDPFEDSSEAVTAYTDGRYAELALHNLADVLRTRALGNVAERYCSKSEFQVKSLTPTRQV